jgi:hypothetical protein
MSALPRFGSKADIAEGPRHVRFASKSGHQLNAPGCPLFAKRGHAPIAIAAISGVLEGARLKLCHTAF